MKTVVHKYFKSIKKASNKEKIKSLEEVKNAAEELLEML